MLTYGQKFGYHRVVLVETHTLVFSAKLYDLPFRNARGGVGTTPPPGCPCYEKWPGCARVNPPFAGGGGVKRPHFFRGAISPIWCGVAAPNSQYLSEIDLGILCAKIRKKYPPVF